MSVRVWGAFSLVAVTVTLAGCQGKASPASHQLNPEENEVVRVLNLVRENMKLPPLTADPTLSYVARAYAEQTAADVAAKKDPTAPEWVDAELLRVGFPGSAQAVTIDMERLRIKDSVEAFFGPVNRHKYMRADVKVCGVGVAQYQGRGKFYIAVLFAANGANK